MFVIIYAMNLCNVFHNVKKMFSNFNRHTIILSINGH